MLPEGASLTLRFPYPTLDTNNSQKRFSAVDELINQEIKEGFPGAVLAVIKDGKLIKLSHYGAAKKYHADGNELASPQAMQNDTLFDIASNSKCLPLTLR